MDKTVPEEIKTKALKIFHDEIVPLLKQEKFHEAYTIASDQLLDMNCGVFESVDDPYAEETMCKDLESRYVEIFGEKVGKLLVSTIPTPKEYALLDTVKYQCTSLTGPSPSQMKIELFYCPNFYKNLSEALNIIHKESRESLTMMEEMADSYLALLKKEKTKQKGPFQHADRGR